MNMTSVSDEARKIRGRIRYNVVSVDVATSVMSQLSNRSWK